MNGLLITTFAVATVVLTSGCQQAATAARFSAEEKGYLSHFETALEASCKVGTTVATQTGMVPTQTQCGVTPMGTPLMCQTPMPVFTNVEVKDLRDAGVDVRRVAAEAAITLAPADLTEAHRTLAIALDGEASGRPQAEAKAQARQACSAFRTFQQTVAAREQEQETTDSVYLTFKPHIGPSVTYDSRDGLSFGVDHSIAVPVKYGKLIAGYREARGIHSLRIVFRDKQRIFLLDRPFEFLIPAGYSNRISYAGGDELVIYVDGPA
jgi:hypothetical protein